jgi:hypothetical protein
MKCERCGEESKVISRLCKVCKRWQCETCYDEPGHYGKPRYRECLECRGKLANGEGKVNL